MGLSRKGLNPSDPEARARESSLFIGSLEKGLLVLQAFNRERRTMGLSEIAKATGLDKSSVQRFAYTLNVLGFLRKDEATKRYSLSPRALELSFAYLQTDSLLEYATPLLYEAGRQCGESISISELVGTEMVYVARVPGQHVIAVKIFLGMHYPAFACAPGRAVLASLDEAQTRDILEASRLRKFTPRTVSTKTGVLREIRTARQQGFAIAEEQCYLGEISVAAPIFNGAGQASAALNVSVPSARWSVGRARSELVPLVVDTARMISHAQGAAGTHPWFFRLGSGLHRSRRGPRAGGQA